MKSIIFCLLLAASLATLGCSSAPSDQGASSETVNVDGREISIDKIQELMQVSGMSAEEAERTIRAGIAQNDAEGSLDAE